LVYREGCIVSDYGSQGSEEGLREMLLVMVLELNRRMCGFTQEYAGPEIVVFCASRLPPPSATKAQIRMAIHAIGTMTVLAMNSHLRLFGCIYRNGIWINQKRRKEIMVFVVMP